MVRSPVCGWTLEEDARKRGARRIAGVDEVGRGPLFGPVVAAAVILAPGFQLDGLTDSKKLSEKKRIEFDVEIRANAVAWAIAAVDAETIDRINIRQASLEAMCRAVEQLALSPDFLLIDGRDTIDWHCPQPLGLYLVADSRQFGTHVAAHQVTGRILNGVARRAEGFAIQARSGGWIGLCRRLCAGRDSITCLRRAAAHQVGRDVARVRVTELVIGHRS
jgi:ribonuclease HII